VVVNSNLGPVLLRFRDIAAQHPTPISPEFVDVSLIADVGSPRSEDPKLIIRVITFELIQHIRPRYINVTDGQTDGRLTVAIPRNAYSASRGI